MAAAAPAGTRGTHAGAREAEHWAALRARASGLAALRAWGREPRSRSAGASPHPNPPGGNKARGSPGADPSLLKSQEPA